MTSQCMNNILCGLSGSQQEAVVTTDGPCLLLSGPGTGKTKVLTTRVAYLLAKKNIKPENIVALTFTNKAAHEMCERVAQMVKGDVNGLLCGTFYSCFAGILRRECSSIDYNSSFSIYDFVDSRALLESIIKTKKLDEDRYKVCDIAAKISLCKSSIITSEEYIKNDKFLEDDKNHNIECFGEIYRKYDVICKKNNAMDFDDLLLNVYLLFKKNAKIRCKYQEMFKYVFVDEFQDTSKIQYQLIKIISEKHHNICVAGDDSQGVFSSCGGRIDNILEFKKDFKNCKVFNLEQSYRSAERIINISNSIIEHDKHRIPKKVIPKQVDKSSNNGQVDIIKTLTPTEEAHSVALFVENVVKEKKIKYSDIAVLYRTDAQVALLETAFNRAGIKYKVHGTPSLFQKKIIKSIIGYLRVIINPFDGEGIKLSINKPCRGLGGGILEKIYCIVERTNISLWEAFTEKNDIFDKKSKDLLAKYVEIIQGGRQIVSSQNAYEVVSFILSDIGILEKFKKGKSEKYKQSYLDIVHFLNIVKAFVGDENNTDKSLYAFLQRLPFKDEPVEEDRAEEVSLMTVHSCKGLEFRCVCVMGLNEGLFPFFYDAKTVDIEEERRLFYVAVTRSKDILSLSFSETINKNGVLDVAPQSRFFKEIDEKYFGEENVKNLENIKEKTSRLTKDYAKYSIFNYSIINKRSRAGNVVNYVSPELLVRGKRFHYSQYGWGMVTGKVMYGGMTLIKGEFEECGVHEVVYDPNKIFVCS